MLKNDNIPVMIRISKWVPWNIEWIQCINTFGCHESVTTNDSITRNNASAVPSLNKLSHSNIRVNLFGAQSSLKRANTETGSVADISDQNKSATTKEIGNPRSQNI
jgi:hypothetical protein